MAARALKLREGLRDEPRERELGHIPTNKFRVESMIAATQFSSVPTLGLSTLGGQVHRCFVLWMVVGAVMFDTEEGGCDDKRNQSGHEGHGGTIPLIGFHRKYPAQLQPLILNV